MLNMSKNVLRWTSSITVQQSDGESEALQMDFISKRTHFSSSVIFFLLSQIWSHFYFNITSIFYLHFQRWVECFLKTDLLIDEAYSVVCCRYCVFSQITHEGCKAYCAWHHNRRKYSLVHPVFAHCR